LRYLSRRAIGQSFRLGLPLIAVGILAAPLILKVFGSGYSEDGTALMRWLLLGGIPNVIVALGVTVARIEHRGVLVALPSAVHAVITIALSAILIPSQGITGVGIAFTVSQTVIALALAVTILRPLLGPEAAEGERPPRHGAPPEAP
jgi:O-antigen/teichoic acid export membrane protein